MLNGYGSKVQTKKSSIEKAIDAHHSGWHLFLKAVNKILTENSYRMDIDEQPYLVDIRLPKGMDIHSISGLKPLSSDRKVIG